MASRDYQWSTERYRARAEHRTDPEPAQSHPPVPGKRTQVERMLERERQALRDGMGLDPTPGNAHAAHVAHSAHAAHVAHSAHAAHAVQRRAVRGTSVGDREPDDDHVHAAAARGTRGTGAPLPYLDRIQRAFGRHDVRGIRAFIGGEATEAARTMGAMAFATGDLVAFADEPTLETAAHEAAHVVQQRSGVQLAGGVGRTGDAYEHNADAVAARVVAGASAEALLDAYAPSASAASASAASAFAASASAASDAAAALAPSTSVPSTSAPSTAAPSAASTSAPSTPAPSTSAPSAAIQHRKIQTQDSEIVTETLTRDQILALYKKLRRENGDQYTQYSVGQAILNREYQGARIDLSRVRDTPRNLAQVLHDHRREDYAPDLCGDRTVGFEVEFGFHQNPVLNFTHIELARSSLDHRINNLPFKLETDSGSTVEIVTPPLWIDSDEEQSLKQELEAFAKGSVTTPITITDWIQGANNSYAMGLVATSASEIRRGVNMFNVDEKVDIPQAQQLARRRSLQQDVGNTVLSVSQKDPTGAHTQTNKAISISEYGAQREGLYERIRNDLQPLTHDLDLFEVLEANGMMDDVFRDSLDLNALIATIMLMRNTNKQETATPGTAAYLWQSHMQCVARIFREVIVAVPEQVNNPFGVPQQDNSGPVCTLLGEKSVTGALATIGENLELILQNHAWTNRDSSVLTVQPEDTLTSKKGKAMAGWHTNVKDVIGSWFKGDLRQVLLNEKVGFPLAEQPGVLEQKVIAQWQQEVPVQLAPYYQSLRSLGVTVDGQGVITAVSDAWLKLPLPEPQLYLREWEATLRSICRLIEQVTAEHKQQHINTSFDAPGFLDHINDHLYNPREDTMINSQSVARFPEGLEHQYVVEKR
jgi:Domain of unknown function (DUF4157)